MKRRELIKKMACLPALAPLQALAGEIFPPPETVPVTVGNKYEIVLPKGTYMITSSLDAETELFQHQRFITLEREQLVKPILTLERFM